MNPKIAFRTMSEVGSVVRGFASYYRHGEASEPARLALLDLHCRSNGMFTEAVASVLRRVNPPCRPQRVSGYLGELPVEKQMTIAGRIREDGFYIFDRRLPADLCDEVERFARATPAAIEGGKAGERLIYDSANPVSQTYKIPLADVACSSGIHKLMADPCFLALAQVYLRTEPILAGIDVWWSSTYGHSPGDAAAQMFHFDFDPPPAWLHFFFYICDVGSGDGPHVFVRGSHRPGNPQTAAFRARGYTRIPDQEIRDQFGSENVVELYGPRGTIIAVDTRGFHKGKIPITGHRLVAQLIFCSPQYNKHQPRQGLPAQIEPVLRDAITAFPNVYQRYPQRK